MFVTAAPPRRLVRRTLRAPDRLAAPPLAAGSLHLESTQALGDYGRYDYVALAPTATLTARGRRAVLSFAHGPERAGDTFDLLDELTSRAPRPADSDDLPWPGGPAGWIAYDLGRAIETLPSLARDDLSQPDVALGVYDAIAVRDRLAGTLTLAASGWPEEGRAAADAAMRRLDRLEAALTARPPSRRDAAIETEPLRSDVSRAAYEAAIARIQEAIAAGDIYQANYAQRFTARRGAAAPDVDVLWDRVRRGAPAPFAGAVAMEHATILSASPELFLRRRSGDALTRPIKGTRPRGADPVEDRRLAAELVASEKDRAEHVMIVDVSRNDLGRVSVPGGVTVSELLSLESFSGVHHLTSTVCGRLAGGTSTSALLRATFPGASITGAPKIRAMEIIEECEPVRRGVYTGAFGWFAWGGDCDLAMAIRTLVVTRDHVHLSVGGGIVADSRADDEYEETLVKGRTLACALGMADAHFERACVVSR